MRFTWDLRVVCTGSFLLFPFYSRSECHEEGQLGTELSPLDRVNGVCNATNKNILTQFRSICKLKSSGRIIAKCSSSHFWLIASTLEFFDALGGSWQWQAVSSVRRLYKWYLLIIIRRIPHTAGVGTRVDILVCVTIVMMWSLCRIIMFWLRA